MNARTDQQPLSGRRTWHCQWLGGVMTGVHGWSGLGQAPSMKWASAGSTTGDASTAAPRAATASKKTMAFMGLATAVCHLSAPFPGCPGQGCLAASSTEAQDTQCCAHPVLGVYVRLDVAGHVRLRALFMAGLYRLHSRRRGDRAKDEYDGQGNSDGFHRAAINGTIFTSTFPNRPGPPPWNQQNP